MKLWEWLTDWAKSATERPTALRAPDNNVDPGMSGAPLVADQHYLRIWLREMCLRDDKIWFTNRIPAVHSLAVLEFGSEKLELANISGKSTLDLKQASLDRSIMVNYKLTGLLPFRGGSVQLDCGLASMQNDNVLESFLNVVSTFASKLTLSQVSSAIDIAGPVADGIQTLLGAGKVAPKLSYRTVFTAGAGGEPLTTGYIFVSEKHDGTLTKEQVFVRDGKVMISTNGGAPKRPEPHDYMLLQIESVVERDDWKHLSAIAQPFQQAIEAKLDEDMPKATLLYNQARMAAYKSADLTGLDKKRVLEALKKMFDNPLEAGAPALEAAARSYLALAMKDAPSPLRAGTLPDLDETLFAA